MKATAIGELEVGGEKKTLASSPAISEGKALCAVDRDRVKVGTILLVEDEDFVREVTCEVLRSCGYRVLTAADAREAEKIYSDTGNAIDLLLTDVVLPGETGPDLARRLRNKNPALKVLLATGYGEQMEKLTKSCEPCLAKPFSSEGLVQRVRQVMENPALQWAESGALARAHSLQDLNWNFV